MLRPPILFSALLVFVIACGKGGVEEGPCRKDAEALTKLLREANSDPPIFYAGDTKLVARNDLPGQAIEKRPVDLVIQPGMMRLRFGTIDSAGQLAKQLAELRQETGSNRIYFMIDEATQWKYVVEAVQAAELAGFTAPAFVFQSEVKLTPPPRSSVDDQLDAIMKDEPSERATKVAELMSKQIASCPALKKSFGAVSSVEGEDKATILIEAISEGLVECKCQLNIGALRSVMWRILANPTPHRVLALDNTAPTTKIRQVGTLLWKDASKRLTPDLKSAVFEVE